MAQLILPSLMSKNQKELNQDLKHMRGVAKELHLDVVDHRFAPNHSLDFNFKLSPHFTYQVHLMVINPEDWIKRLERKKNSKQIILYIPEFEALKNPAEFIREARRKGRRVSFAIVPETSISKLKPYLKDIDVLLVLTVHPGFYGAKFLPKDLKKISQIKKLNPKIKVIVDGGMNPDTIKLAVKAGADLFVSGSYTTKAEKPKERMKSLIKAARLPNQKRG